jgi:CRP-like cAMP-binding protein
MEQPADPVTALKSIPLLAGLPHGDLERLAKKARVERHGPGAELIKEGTSGSSVFFIVAGQCEVRRAGGRIALLGRGQFFGELSILDPAPRTATVSVYEASTLLVLEGYDFRAALTTNTAMAHHLIRVLAERLRAFTDDYAPRVR